MALERVLDGSTCSTERVRVVLAVEAVLTRDALACLLRSTGFEVVAEVGDGGALLASIAATRADVAVVDAWVPATHRFDVLDVACRIRRVHPRIGLLMLANHAEIQHLGRLLATTAHGLGYLIKERIAGSEALAAAVRTVACGGCAIDPEIASILRGARRMDPVASLSVRERDVLALMAEGCSNQGVAQRLHLTEKTVESHVRSILLRLGIATEPQLHRRVLAVLHWLQAGHAPAGPASPLPGFLDAVASP
jgi:DNA-binding NarL/FixJ family response regulator